MQKISSTEQVTKLLRKLQAAQRAFDRFDGFDKLITESEVRLRYDAIVGSLLIFENDICGMRSEWMAEDAKTETAAEINEAPQTSHNTQSMPLETDIPL